MKLNENLKRWIKRLSITGLIVFVICDAWLRIMGAEWDYRGYDTSSVLNTLLGEKLYNVNFRTISYPGFKELDILKWSKEEWEALTCYLPGKMSYEFGSTRYKKLEFVYDSKSKTFLKAPLAKCLQIYGDPGWKYPYCNHWTSDSCIHLEIHDYVLQKPEYLNKIVQILEQPCKYFPTDKKLREVGATDAHSTSAIRSARGQLSCGKKNKHPKRYILTVLDPKFKPRFDIVINRKD